MLRRTFLRRSGLAALGLAAGGSVFGCGSSLTSQAQPGAGGGTPLRLRPPPLVNPQRLRLTEADLGDRGEIDLYGEGRDWIIELPTDAPIARGFSIHGRDEARHIVIVGGAVVPRRRTDLRTTRYVGGGGYAVSALRGFTGATGGTFRVRCAENGEFTARLPFDATPSRISAAIEAVLGRGAVQAVDGPVTPGGPWRFVPADARMGRVQFDLGDLTGAPTAVEERNDYSPFSSAIKFKQWRGTLHVEGVYMGGSYCDEGVNIQNPWASAVAQFANVRIDVRAYAYHADWHHPDAMQCYLGPTSLRMERSDLICAGSQGIIGQPRQTATPRSLERLDDWWFRDVLFQTRANRPRGEERPGSPIYVEDDWPQNNYNSAGWRWDMRNCYSSRLGLDRREYGGSPVDYYNHYTRPLPRGLRIKARPPGGGFCSPERDECGLAYVAPPRTGSSPAPGRTRLVGERRV